MQKITSDPRFAITIKQPTQRSMMASCACRRPPPTVDITSALFNPSVAGNLHGEIVHEHDQLLANLQVWGWSPLVIDLSVLQEREETSRSPLARMHPTVLKRQIESLFAKDVIEENPPLYSIYRGRKSESGGSKTIEPKQSWEVSRCSLHADNDLRVQLLERWTLALHAVAMAVSNRLNWPQNLLVQDGPCDLHHSPTSPCNVDLLRVFFYDRIIPPPNTTPRSAPLVLGSSPHSDWGSLTVVWQDDVGGLQHFCVRCRAWVDIAPAPVTSQKLHLVVHLGDVASLAIGHTAAAVETGKAAATPTAAAAAPPSASPRGLTTTTSPPWSWPSPRHRVLCSTVRNRVSLVYFCYPPPRLSLQDLEDGLRNWSTNIPPTIMPYSCYALLHNQSSSSSTASGDNKEQPKNNKNSNTPSNPQEMYRSIRARPLQEVFAEKWLQVQRGS